jgi:type I restriction enzyme, S subunit
MKTSWNSITFENAIEFTQIGIVRNKKEQSPDFEYRYFKMNNIKNTNGIDETSFAFINASEEEVTKYKLFEGDFLFNTRNSFELVGKSCLYRSNYNIPTLFNNNILRVRFNSNFLPTFVSYAFSCKEIREKLKKMKSGTTSVVGIYYKSLRKLILPQPTLTEQKRIVAKLDKCFEAIDKARANVENNLQNAKDLFQSQLSQMFSQKGDGWVEKKLNEICEIKGRIGYRGYTKGDLVDKGEGAITLSPSNITDNVFNTRKCTYISWFKYNESPEIMVFNGDILFVKTGSTYGKVALVKDLKEKATINPQFVVLKDIQIQNAFLYYYLTTHEFKEKIENIVGGTATPTLSQTNLGNQSISYPHDSEQKVISEKLNQLGIGINKIKLEYDKKLNDLEELKKSILQKAFNGEL